MRSSARFGLPDGRPVACDLHIHTALSHDGAGSVDDCCRRAVELGLDAVAITEHVDFDPADPGYGFFRYEAIADAVRTARKRYGHELVVLLGVEVDYQAWFEEKIAAFLDTYRFDYVIGSVHAVEGLTVMSDGYLAHRQGARVYGDYYAAVCRSAESGLFDSIGHFGYALRRGLRKVGPPHGEALEAERLALQAVAESGACLEVNGAGLRHGVGTLYPSQRVLRSYRELGGRYVTIGSDAHRPDDVGTAVAEAGRCIAETGLTAVCPEYRTPLSYGEVVDTGG